MVGQGACVDGTSQVGVGNSGSSIKLPALPTSSIPGVLCGVRSKCYFERNRLGMLRVDKFRNTAEKRGRKAVQNPEILYFGFQRNHYLWKRRHFNFRGIYHRWAIRWPVCGSLDTRKQWGIMDTMRTRTNSHALTFGFWLNTHTVASRTHFFNSSCGRSTPSMFIYRITHPHS